jgi:glutamine synthetase type III
MELDEKEVKKIVRGEVIKALKLLNLSHVVDDIIDDNLEEVIRDRISEKMDNDLSNDTQIEEMITKATKDETLMWIDNNISPEYMCEILKEAMLEKLRELTFEQVKELVNNIK